MEGEVEVWWRGGGVVEMRCGRGGRGGGGGGVVEVWSWKWRFWWRCVV